MKNNLPDKCTVHTASIGGDQCTKKSGDYKQMPLNCNTDIDSGPVSSVLVLHAQGFVGCVKRSAGTPVRSEFRSEFHWCAGASLVTAYRTAH